LQLAIVGRRNVGKSTFINSLAEEERVIVSEVEGTTRDSIDVRFDVDGKTLIAIDTAGVRKRKSLAGDIEFYSLVRAKESIRKADVVFMFFDATQTISRVDKQLVDEIHERHKPCIFVINKWDLGLNAEMTGEKWVEYLGHNFPTMTYVPIAFLTAKDSKNIRQVVNLAQSIFKQSRERVGTGKLNEVLRDAIERKQPPYKSNRRPKIYYATKVSTAPPTIVLKCNDPKLFSKDWTRYLLGVFREKLPFREVPVRLIFRARESADASQE
jgi:GTP-binding protein